jgi:hypothetical protein
MLPLYAFMECKGAASRFHLPETYSNSVVSAAMHHRQTFATKKTVLSCKYLGQESVPSRIQFYQVKKIKHGDLLFLRNH